MLINDHYTSDVIARLDSNISQRERGFAHINEVFGVAGDSFVLVG
jgi:hypothetical protein